MDIITYALCKKKISNAISSSGAIKGDTGKSAYEIAVEAGFTGTVQEWLDSLNGSSPYVGENGNWWVDSIDTGVAAGTESIPITNIEELFNEEEN